MNILEKLRSNATSAKYQVFNPNGADYLFEGKLLYQHKSDDGKHVLVKVYESRKGKFVVEDKTCKPVKVHVTSDWLSIFGTIGYDEWAKNIYRELGIEEFQRI